MDFRVMCSNNKTQREKNRGKTEKIQINTILTIETTLSYIIRVIYHA